jgi:hypothetical protein
MVRTKALPNIFVYKHVDGASIEYDEARKKGFQEVYIMCLKEGQVCEELSMERWKKTTLQKFEVVKSPIVAVRYRDVGLIEVSTQKIKKYFSTIEASSDTVLIFPLFLVNVTAMQLYNLQFKGMINLMDVMKVYAVDTLMRCNRDKYMDHFVRIDMVRSMVEAKFWMLPMNCGHNINFQFTSRTFNVLNLNTIPDNNVRTIIAEMDKQPYVLTTFKKDVFVDPALYVPKRGFCLYRISPPSAVDTKAFRHILAQLLDKNIKEAYYLAMYTLVSKDACHLVLKNMDLLTSRPGGQRTFADTFVMELWYTLGYAWISMYMEECIRKSYMTNADRFIFTADEAAALPYYPFDSLNPSTSPYLPIMIKNSTLNITKNAMSVDLMKFYSKDIGVAKSELFRRRLNLFVTGRDMDVFEGLDWNGFGITGSVIAACLPRYNPLTELFENDYLRFFDHFYEKADVDIMVSAKGLQFVEKAYSLLDVIQNNIQKIHPEATAIITYTKTVTLVSNVDMSLDDAYAQYLAHMEKYVLTLDNDEKYNALRNVVHKSEVKLLIRERNDKALMIFNNIKFKILSDHLKHDLEVFSINIAPIAVVARFYLPIVRAYYDGAQVHLTPSCVSACMTLINMDYKYFAGTKDPIEVVNKYRMRGFSIYLNRNELRRFVLYNLAVEPWKTCYLGSMKGYLPISHPLFKKNIQFDNQLIEQIYPYYLRAWKIPMQEMLFQVKKQRVELFKESAISLEGLTVPFQSRILDKVDFSQINY